ncbi:MAG: S41 family peptidase [Sphaerochaeta sp.]
MKKTLKLICCLLIFTLPIFASGSKEPKNALSEIQPTTTVVPAEQKVTSNDTSEESIQTIKDNLNSLFALYSFIDTYSINDLDPDKSFDAIASALVDSLDDKYSVYITEDEIADFEETNLGTYSGIGSYILKLNPQNIDLDDPESYMIKIESPFPGGPADRAGLRANDLISHIDGEAVNNLTGTEASTKLKGEVGTEVTLTVVRGDNTFDITLKRAVIEIPSTVYDIINNHIGYLQISQFIESTDDDAAAAIQDMINNGIDSLIIDLRNNGGGVVEDATNIANLFLDGQNIVTTQNKETLENNTTKTVSSSDTLVPMDFPVVILVNGGTASSSEILTGALKDNNRATVIGAQTFGKGVMQQIFSLNKALVKLTVAHYLTPNGTDINGVGITPDIIMEDHEMTDEEFTLYEDIMNDNIISDYVDANPEFTQENVDKFVAQYDDQDIYQPFLKILVRNEYLYRMDYDDRPKYDSVNDEYLKTAIDFLEK